MKSNYRPDIDGLRAVAIISVILFHLDAQYLSGGFLGVDIFFVISGFLISKIIIQEKINGNFSFLNFYARRFKRIFPALFVVLAVCSVASFLLLSPEAFERFYDSMRYASFQASNFFFAKKVGYFDEGNDLQPLLHTWSLAVEEQFYLTWPLLLVGMAWLALKTNLGQRKTIAVGIGIIAVATYLLFIKTSQSNYDKAFYMFYTRAWEFCFGAILPTTLLPSFSKNVASIVGIAAAAALGYSLFFFTESSNPIYLFLLPTFATALIIHCKEGLVGRLLSFKLFVGIGLISYSMYLWHWPLISFYKIISLQKLHFQDEICIFLATVAVSILSYKFVEQPFRAKREKITSTYWGLSHNARINIIGLLVAGLFAVSAVQINRLANFLPRMSLTTSPQVLDLANLIQANKDLYTQKLDRNFTPYKNGEKFDISKHNGFTCSFDGIEKRLDFNFAPIMQCLSQQLSAEENYLIIGDSHGRDILHILKKKFPEKNFAMLFQSACVALRQTNSKNCFPRYEEFMQQHLGKLNIKGLIFASRYDYENINLVLQNLNNLNQSELDIYVVGSSPDFTSSIRNIVLYQNLQGDDLNTYIANKNLSYNPFTLNEKIKSEIGKIQALGKNIVFINKLAEICPNGSCPIIIPNSDGVPLYVDRQHFSIEGIDYLSQNLSLPIK